MQHTILHVILILTNARYSKLNCNLYTNLYPNQRLILIDVPMYKQLLKSVQNFTRIEMLKLLYEWTSHLHLQHEKITIKTRFSLKSSEIQQYLQTLITYINSVNNVIIFKLISSAFSLIRGFLYS